MREKESAPYEKLKVSPWYDKPAKPKNTKHENIQTKPKPVSKKEVEVESKAECETGTFWIFFE